MAKVITKIFDQYLSVLFSDFSTKNVSSQLLKGHLEVHDVHVRKELLKEALSPVFPNLEIRRAVCDRVVLKIPVSRLSSEPTLVQIGVLWGVLELGLTPQTLHVVLEEPLALQAASTNLLDLFRPKNAKNAKPVRGEESVRWGLRGQKTVNWNFGLKIALSCRIEIGSVRSPHGGHTALTCADSRTSRVITGLW